MSGTSAIAGVTAVLRAALEADLAASVNGARVIARTLDRAQPAEAANLVNLFLYQVSTNAAFSNLPMPGTNPAMDGMPPLALTLHYLLTVYGADDAAEVPVDGQRLLGIAMRSLMDRPELGRDRIRVLAPESGLEDQIDRVRITPRPMTLDEVSRLWPAFQAPYRLSTAFEASCVLIESARTRPTPLPVLRRGPDDTGYDSRATLHPFPFIEAWGVGDLKRGYPAARIGDSLVFQGMNLETHTGGPVTMRFRSTGGDLIAEVPTVPGEGGVLSAEIRAQAPGGGAAPRWRAGILTATVFVPGGYGGIVESNPVVVPLAPHITDIEALGGGAVADRTGPIVVEAGDPDQVVVAIMVEPPVDSTQVISGTWGSDRLELVARADPGPWNNVQFRLRRASAVAPHGTSRATSLRVSVDHVESLPFLASGGPMARRFEMDPTQQVEVRWS